MSNTKYKLQKNKTKCSILNTLFTQDTQIMCYKRQLANLETTPLQWAWTQSAITATFSNCSFPRLLDVLLLCINHNCYLYCCCVSIIIVICIVVVYQS